MKRRIFAGLVTIAMPFVLLTGTPAAAGHGECSGWKPDYAICSAGEGASHAMSCIGYLLGYGGQINLAICLGTE